jgi:YD repeat-containing protein
MKYKTIFFRAITTSLILGIAGNCLGQADITLPTILPPGPEAASIVRGNVLSLSKNNGLATANIPLHEMKLKDFSLPIALGYASSGVKVDAIPGRVGTDWSLNAGGVITRIVHGLPDDHAIRVQPYPNFDMSLPDTSRGIITFLETLTGKFSWDAEPDEFHIAAPGISTKFILDSNGKALQIPYSNIQIEVMGGPWNGGGRFTGIKVTNTNGVVYYFGGNAIERTSANGNQLSGFLNISTAFFLKSIKTPAGESIDFNYQNVGSSNFTGVNFYVKIPYAANQNTACETQPCTQITGSFLHGDLSSANILTSCLSSITASDGSSVNFYYEERNDVSGDNRLKNILISNGSRTIKSYRCTYADYTPVLTNAHERGNDNKRFFLDSIIAYSAGDPLTSGPYPSDSLVTSLEYNSPGSLPSRLSYSQDHWGYFNGKFNVNLLPATAGLASAYASADRQPDSMTTSFGMLKRINYPTGGYQQFVLEPNKQTFYERKVTEVIVSVDGSSNSSSFESFYSTDTLRPKQPVTATFTITAFQNPGCSSCTPTPPNTTTFMRCFLLDGQTGDVVNTYIMREYSEYVIQEQLESGRTYVLQLSIKGAVNAGSFSIKYDTAAAPVYHYVDKLIGGMRVKQIINYDPVSDKVNNTYYKYVVSLSQDVSSVVNTYNIQYLTESEEWSLCHMQGMYNEVSPKCFYTILSSSGLAAGSVNLFDNGYFGYTSIIESNSPDYSVGGIIHEYLIAPRDPVVSGFGHPFNSIPSDINSSTNGYEFRTTYFDGAKKTRKKEEHFYAERSDNYHKEYDAVTARRLWDYHMMVPSNPVMVFQWLASFDAVKYRYSSDWIKLDSTVVTEFDVNDNELQTLTKYEYGSPDNILPVTSSSVSSAGEIIASTVKYPTDYSTISPYDKMIRRNMISMPVEVKKMRNSVQLSKTTNVFTDVFGDSSLFKPGLVKFQKRSTDTEEDRLLFNKYDHSGNNLELAKASDNKVSYLWDYQSAYPVAQVINSPIASVAYTSFEAGGKGNWSYAGTAADSSVTGKKSYILNGINDITCSGLNSTQSYIITYWSRGGTATVNGSGGTALTSKNGWTLFSHEISSRSDITVSGTVKIDELRLFPKNAQMTTYTYEPLVGVTSICDINNRITYYEYDSFNRLQRIRDQDRNILKTFDYKYKEVQ